MPVGVMGLVSGSFRAGGNSKDGSILATGTVQASNLSYNGLAADQAQADVTYDGHVVNVNQGHADVGGAVLISAAPMMSINNGRDFPLQPMISPSIWPRRYCLFL